MNIDKIREQLARSFLGVHTEAMTISEKTIYVVVSSYKDRVYTYVSSYCQSAEDLMNFEESAKKVFA